MKNKLKKYLEILAISIFKLLNSIGRNGWLITVNCIIRRAYWKAKLKKMGVNSVLLPNLVIRSPEMVEIGENVAIGEFVHIWGGGGVSIGNDSLIAAHSSIISQTHDVNASLFRNSQVTKPIVIGENVWIGSGAIILPGVTIGNGVIVAAGAVVTHDIADRCVAIGMPARAKCRSL